MENSIHSVDFDRALPPFISNQMSLITACAGAEIPEEYYQTHLLDPHAPEDRAVLERQKVYRC